MRYKKIYRRDFPGRAASSIISEQTDKKNALKCNEDTIIRTEIQGIILSKIEQGKSKDDIKRELSQNSRYEKYNQYFESWIENKIKKQKSRNRQQIQK